MLSIIIVNFRTWAYTQRAIDFLLSSIPPDIRPNRDMEIIVVDNHSKDACIQEFCRNNPNIRLYLSQGNYGYSHGCNQGALHARGDWLLFMNPDVKTDWKTVNKLLEAAKADSSHAIFTARQLDESGKPQRTFAPFTTLATISPLVRALTRATSPGGHPDPNRLREDSESILTVDWVSGSLLLISRTNFKILDGWNEDFWLYCEDEDLCKRARNLGLLAAQYCGATLTHTHASSTRTTPEIRVLAKSEAIISKHVYIHKHLQGKERFLACIWMEVDTYVKVVIWGIANLLTLGLSSAIRQKYFIHLRVSSHLIRSHKTRIYLSDKSKNYSAARI